MQGCILTSVVLLTMCLYYGFVYLPENSVKQNLKKVATPSDNANAQDDDFCNILAAIKKSRTYPQFEKCATAIYQFQSKYGESITGKLDVTQLLNFYEEQTTKHLPMEFA